MTNPASPMTMPYEVVPSQYEGTHYQHHVVDTADRRTVAAIATEEDAQLVAAALNHYASVLWAPPQCETFTMLTPDQRHDAAALTPELRELMWGNVRSRAFDAQPARVGRGE